MNDDKSARMHHLIFISGFRVKELSKRIHQVFILGGWLTELAPFHMATPTLLYMPM